MNGPLAGRDTQLERQRLKAADICQSSECRPIRQAPNYIRFAHILLLTGTSYLFRVYITGGPELKQSTPKRILYQTLTDNTKNRGHFDSVARAGVF